MVWAIEQKLHDGKYSTFGENVHYMEVCLILIWDSFAKSHVYQSEVAV